MKDDKPKQKPLPFRSKRRYDASEYRQVGLAFAIPGLLLAGPLVGYGLGWAAEIYLGFPEWVRLVGLGLGFASGVRESVVALKRLTKEQERERSRDE